MAKDEGRRLKAEGKATPARRPTAPLSTRTAVDRAPTAPDPEEAAIVALLDLEPIAFNRVLRKAALSGRYGIRPSAVQMLRKMVLDVAVQFGEALAVRNVQSLREIGARGC